MKKAITICLLASMLVWTGGPSLACADDDGWDNATSTESEIEVNAASSLIQPSESNGGGGNDADDPVIKAKFEARACRSDEENKQITYEELNDQPWCEDDFDEDGAQLVPSGKKDVNTTALVCAVVAHPYLNTESELEKLNVSADLYYPLVKSPIEGSSKQFCGSQIEQITLYPVTDRDDNLEAFCESPGGIRYMDPSLVEFYDDYDYDDVCEELYQQEAMLFCGTRSLSYEDPSGDYFVKARAVYSGAEEAVRWNSFAYLDLPAFEADFTQVAYDPPVNQGLFAHKDGDANFALGDGKPTVRSTGNRVLALHINQDDMGFGKSSGNWNVKYKTRLGAEYVWNDVGYYKPSQFKADVAGGDVEPGVLSDEKGYDIDSWLDLSETEKMDFGIYVIKYPSSPGTVYSGHMTIEAEDVDFAACGQSPMPI